MAAYSSDNSRSGTSGPVITGIGMIGALGSTRSEVWQGLLAGRPRMGPITSFDAAAYGVADCVVAEIDPAGLTARLAQLSRRGLPVPRKGRFRHLALIAAAEALDDAALPLDDAAERFSAGVILGSNSAGAHEIERVVLATHAGHKPRVADNLGKRTSVAIQDIARAFDLGGPMFGVDAACASSAVAFTQACRLVACGAAPWCLVGGVDVPIVASNIKLAHVLGVLARAFADEPERASRPFELRRDGYVTAEGACFMVVEDHAHAEARGARCYARVAGFAEHTYTGHPTQLSATFAESVMRHALHQARLPAGELGWVSAHATATVQGDAAEAAAICSVLEGCEVPCSATKSVTGHLLGASSAYQTAFAAMSLDEQHIPPTINLEEQDPNCPVHCPTEALAATFDHVMSNAFGFGGAGASVILQRAE